MTAAVGQLVKHLHSLVGKELLSLYGVHFELSHIFIAQTLEKVFFQSLLQSRNGASSSNQEDVIHQLGETIGLERGKAMTETFHKSFLIEPNNVGLEEDLGGSNDVRPNEDLFRVVEFVDEFGLVVVEIRVEVGLYFQDVFLDFEQLLLVDFWIGTQLHHLREVASQLLVLEELYFLLVFLLFLFVLLLLLLSLQLCVFFEESDLLDLLLEFLPLLFEFIQIQLRLFPDLLLYFLLLLLFLPPLLLSGQLCLLQHLVEPSLSQLLWTQFIFLLLQDL